MKTKLLLAVIAAAISSCLIGHSQAAAQDSVPMYVWYVKRTATHISSGYSYTQSYGPYYSYLEAYTKKQQLDAVPSYGTFAFGKAYIEKAINPILFQPHLWSQFPLHIQLQLYMMANQ